MKLLKITENRSIDIKLSKTRISNIFQSGAFLGITTATSAIDAITPKKMHGSGATTLII